jgi:hypothetical protein
VRIIVVEYFFSCCTKQVKNAFQIHNDAPALMSLMALITIPGRLKGNMNLNCEGQCKYNIIRSHRENR